jgi:hypothetical protein
MVEAALGPVVAAAEGMKTCACDSSLVAKVQALEAAYSDLAAEVAALKGRGASRLSQADQHKLAAILPAVLGLLGSENFLVRELFRTDAAALRLVLGSCSAKSVGRLLRRAGGVPVNGLVVLRVGTQDGSALWAIEKVLS